MAKVKLTVNSDQFDKFKIACDIEDVLIVEQTKYGNVKSCVVNYKHPSQLYKVGLLQYEVDKPVKELEQESKDGKK